jgi:hypothetical protein
VRGERVRRALQLLTALAATLVGLAGAALGEPSVKLHATFTPERLGQETSVRFGAQITMPDGTVPPPLTEAVMRYPAGVDIGLSELGLDTCKIAALEQLGPEGCPAESIMGEGEAVGELQGESEVVREAAHVTVLRAPEREGKLAMLFYVDAKHPVSAQIVIPGLLAPAPARFGGQIEMRIPLVESWPGGPNVAATRVELALGPRGLTYYEHKNGRLLAYHPRGILLPGHCPRGGFRFSGDFAFLDGSRTSSTVSVPCPSRQPTRR